MFKTSVPRLQTEARALLFFNNSRPLNECFYEKVIKVKADVAALLNLFSDVSIDVRW